MADYEIPSDLLDAQRAYDEADRRVQEVTDALPTAQEVMEGAAARPARRQDGSMESGPGLTEDEGPRPPHKSGEAFIRVQLRH